MSPMQMELSVDFHFSSAHRLPYYNGACARLHGHNYVLRVTVA
ncbi:MAG: 6-pyruvoyl trahydropterin synthase family protein, partial [Myxococcaceae bacterium]